MKIFLITFIITAPSCGCIGWWLHYRFGASVKKLEQTIEARVQLALSALKTKA